MCRKLVYLFSFVLVAGLVGGVASADPLHQDEGPDGIVSIEAENYDGRGTGQSGSEWELVGPTEGFTGVAGMQVLGEGTNDTNYSVESPRLDYVINFAKTGPHYVWIFGWGAGGTDDSCHAGLDGEETPLSNRMSGWSDQYEWNNGRYERPEPSQVDINYARFTHPEHLDAGRRTYYRQDSPDYQPRLYADGRWPRGKPPWPTREGL